ncbi:MAG: toprim domain-containing protein [Prevotellaceae bacterium]|nr:toprim domain-containing protein [Prevotellaceae bacterium]
MSSELTYDDFLNRLGIQDVLLDAGYHLNKRDGLRYPSYVRTDSDGRRVRGDKFIVTQNGKCCFQPPQQKVYNVISFIKEHPELFAENKSGVSADRLVNLVCNRLLNQPVEDRPARIAEPRRDSKPFSLNDYDIHKFNPQDRETQKRFYPYFKYRGIDLYTQYAFHRHFCLATKHRTDGLTFANLSFPLVLPKEPDKTVGFEERGRPKMDGSGGYKGKAEGSNSSEGLWIASPGGTGLKEAKAVYVFESAYDAMAFYQLRMGQAPDRQRDFRSAVYVSTGGNPGIGQMQGLINAAPQATFHLAFDNDMAGKQFAANFEDIARKRRPVSPDKIPADMRPFIESFDKPLKTTTDLLAIEDGQYAELPKPLQELYLKYDSAMAEAMEYHDSPLVCKEDKQEAAETMNKTYRDFKSALLEKLHLQDGQDLSPVEIVREVPSEGYKDFNDELLGKIQISQTGGFKTDRDKTEPTLKGQEENGQRVTTFHRR